MAEPEQAAPSFSSPPNDSIRVSNAVIREISSERGTAYITITYDARARNGSREERVRLLVNRTTMIYDERGNRIPVNELQVGMTVNAAFSSAMTRSLPPQAQAFQIRIVRRPAENPQTAVGRIIEVDARSQSILTISGQNPASAIRFNVSPSTLILDPIGRRIPFSRLFPGLRVRVQHASFMTASIPPQTTAFVIQIIR